MPWSICDRCGDAAEVHPYLHEQLCRPCLDGRLTADAKDRAQDLRPRGAPPAPRHASPIPDAQQEYAG